MKLQSIGGGTFKLEVNENNVYYYENSTLTVYYDFKGEGKVELDADEIPNKVKKAIYNFVPASVKEDLEGMGW